MTDHKNKVKNIVCNGLNRSFVKEIEDFIDVKMKEGWDIITIQNNMITALQNKLQEWNY